MNNTPKFLFNKIKRRYVRSLLWYFVLNISIFALTASLAILNLYSIRWLHGDNHTKWVFVWVAILATMGSLISSLLSLFVLRKNIKNIDKKIDQINEEYDLFNKSEGIYKHIKNNRELFIEEIKKIMKR